MVPRWFREKSAEATFLFRHAFRHNLRIMDRVALFLALPYLVIVIPYDWLALAANKTVFFALNDRHAVDYNYLVANRPDFADAYVGGVIVQLVILVFGVIVHSYFAVTSKDILFVTDRKRLYLGWSSFAIALLVMAAFGASRMTDFGPSAEFSWFADDPESRRKFMPVATNSSAFIMTTMFLTPAAFVPMAVIQVLMIFAFGRRVKFNDIKGDYENGKR